MKKLLSLLLSLSILCTVCACSKRETEKTETDDDPGITSETPASTTTTATTSETTAEETTVPMTVNERINAILDDTIKFWDEVLLPLKEFAEDNDADYFGDEDDVNEFIKNMEIYYSKLVEDQKYLDGLGDEYSDVKTRFNGLFELANNVRGYLTSGIIEVEKPLPCKSDLDLYDKLVDQFMDVVIENYYVSDNNSSGDDYDDYDDDDDDE